MFATICRANAKWQHLRRLAYCLSKQGQYIKVGSIVAAVMSTIIARLLRLQARCKIASCPAC